MEKSTGFVGYRAGRPSRSGAVRVEAKHLLATPGAIRSRCVPMGTRPSDPMLRVVGALHK